MNNETWSERELRWSRHEAELRGTCDTCKAKNVLLACHPPGVWLCFDCGMKTEVTPKPSVTPTADTVLENMADTTRADGGEAYLARERAYARRNK
jgi:hypothetical protein